MEQLYNLFSVPVMRFAGNDNYDAIQCEIKNALQHIEENKDYSTSSYFAEKTYSNKNYNFLEKYNCLHLKKKIINDLDSYLNNLRWNFLKNKDNFSIVNSWINIIHTGDYHNNHLHPGHTISGVYYYRTSAKQGGICFENPNRLMLFGQFPQGPVSPSSVTIIPNDGDTILFPSWLSHSTRKNESVEDRISIAFNIDYSYTKESSDLVMDGFYPYHDTHFVF